MRFCFALIALLLSACVTENSGVPVPEANYAEAAKANATLAVEYARQGQNDLALEKIQRALEQDSNCQPAHATAALIYARRGDAGAATRHFKKALSLDSRDASTRNNYGLFLCEQAKFADAEELLLEAARDRSYSGNAKAWADAGICARRAGDAVKAESYFRQALQISQDEPEALLQLASLAAEEKDWLRVRAFLQRRERVARQTASSLQLAIESERELGDPDAAERYRQQLRRQFP